MTTIEEERRLRNLKRSNDYYHKNKHKIKNYNIDKYSREIVNSSIRGERDDALSSDNPKILLPIIEKQIEIAYKYTDYTRKVESLNYLYELQKDLMGKI